MMDRISRRARRWLIVVVAASACAAAWRVYRGHVLWQATRSIRAAGGSVNVRAQLPDWYPADTFPGFIAALFERRSYEVQFASRPVTDADLAPLEGLPRLEWMELHTTNVTGSGLSAIRRQTGMKRLFLNMNPIGDEGLAHLQGLHELEWLEFGSTRITDAGLRHLSGLTRLRRLDLYNTRVSDAGLQHLAPLSGLEQLRLQGTGITDASVPILSQMRGLKELHVVETAVSDEGIAALRMALPDCNIVD